MPVPREGARADAIERAWRCLEDNPIFLDTETTGLGGDGQICDLAVVDGEGAVLLNTLIKPTTPIPAAATAIHHITDADVASAPSFAEVLPLLETIWDNRAVVIYNSPFDRIMLVQSAEACDIFTERIEYVLKSAPKRVAGSRRPQSFTCAMRLYAQFFGTWNDWRQDYAFQKLGNAAQQCGIAVPSDQHRALADAQLTRQVMHHLAGLYADH